MPTHLLIVRLFKGYHNCNYHVSLTLVLISSTSQSKRKQPGALYRYLLISETTWRHFPALFQLITLLHPIFQAPLLWIISFSALSNTPSTNWFLKVSSLSWEKDRFSDYQTMQTKITLTHTYLTHSTQSVVREMPIPLRLEDIQLQKPTKRFVLWNEDKSIVRRREIQKNRSQQT